VQSIMFYVTVKGTGSAMKRIIYILSCLCIMMPLLLGGCVVTPVKTTKTAALNNQEPNESVIEEATEEVAEEPIEAVTEEVPEEVAEEPIEAVTEEVPEEVAEEPIEAVTEEVPEEVAEEPIETVTEEVPEEVAEEPIEAVTEEVPEEVAEEPTEAVTEEVPEEVAEEAAEETTEQIVTRADESSQHVYTEQLPAITRDIREEQAGDYRVGPEDTLSVTVYGEEDLCLAGIIVSSDGMITYPLIGRVAVENLTTAEVEKKIVSLLADGYLIHPQVTVTVQSFKSKRVFILGAVQNPGVFPLQGRERLLEVISSAGGIQSERAGKFILVLRKGSSNDEQDKNEDTVIKVGIEGLLQRGDMNLNISLENRDVVFVPQAEYVYIIGEVKNPGSYRIYEKDITILETITLAGGFTPIASPNKTRVIRVENGIEKTIPVRMKDIIKGEKSKDIYLRSGDIVVVPESLF